MVSSPVNTLMQKPNTHFTILEMVLHNVLSRRVGDIADTTEKPKNMFIHGAKKCADKKEMELVVPNISKLYELAVTVGQQRFDGIGFHNAHQNGNTCQHKRRSALDDSGKFDNRLDNWRNHYHTNT